MTLDDIQQIAVIGAGLMGHGIAQEFAFAGYQVHLHDVSKEKIGEGLDQIRDNLQMFVENELAQPSQIDETLDRVYGSDQLEVVCREADFVIEAVTENLPLKQEIFRQLDGICPARTSYTLRRSKRPPPVISKPPRRQPTTRSLWPASPRSSASGSARGVC